MTYRTLRYRGDGRIARITLDRPERLNAIVTEMPGEIRDAVGRANDDDAIHVIILAGAGRSFCAGYDLKAFAEDDDPGALTATTMPWDPMADYRIMKRFTDDIATLWHSHKPTICRVQGHAVAGGSDIALSCDFVIMAEDARIGYPPARVWGCPTTAMWVYRLGAEKAKRMLLTGDLIDGVEAKAMGLVLDAVPADLDGDGNVEVVAGSSAGNMVCRRLVKGKTWRRDGAPLLWRFDNFGYGVKRLRAADVDGDGQQEVIVASQTGYLYVLSPEGKVKWQDRAGSDIVEAVVLADLIDPRGHRELAAQEQRETVARTLAAYLRVSALQYHQTVDAIGPIQTTQDGAPLQTQVWASLVYPNQTGEETRLYEFSLEHLPTSNSRRTTDQWRIVRVERKG